MFKRNLNPLKLFGLAFLIFSILGCGGEVTKPTATIDSGKSKDDEVIEQIIDNYYDWARFSQLKDYGGMMKLVAPQSNFEGGTKVCKEIWDAGDSAYYEFSSVGVCYTTKQPPVAYVYGNYTFYQRGVVHESPWTVEEGGFASSSFPEDGEYYGNKWKLDGINLNAGQDWWTNRCN